MGLFDFLFAGPRMEEIKMALVGKYVFNSIEDATEREKIIEFANNRLKEGYSRQAFEHEHTLEEYDPKVKYLFYGLAMMELGIDHGVKKFQWSYVKNPLMVRNYDDKLWEAAVDVLRKRNGINVSI